MYLPGGNLGQHRISTSPLMDPAISALIVMGPAHPKLRSRHLTPMRDRAQAALLQAAAVMDVPVFHILRGSGGQKMSPETHTRHKFSPDLHSR